MGKIRKVTTIWKTREGKKIRICDMTDEHLLNAIKFCELRAKQIKNTVPYPNFNGEMAQMCAEDEPALMDLYLELERRGLEKLPLYT